MATKRKTTRRSSGESGSTLYGALAGLLLGLIVAAVVAFYVTKAPVPFVDRASRQGDTGKLPDPRQAPDPNAGLYGRDGGAGAAPTGPTATAPAPLPGAGVAKPDEPPSRMDDLGALIATLPSTRQPAAAPAPAASPATAPTPISKAPPAAAPAPAAKPAPAASAATGTYYLQAGAFRGENDAESLKARIILLGLPVAVQKAEVNGKPINRVRVGPFARLDDMNRARGRLGENKIETAVVRQ
ncbi:SPOR domain-containing protein [Achromobacter denitrificans]|uniref:SPOR domain-containing protein n=2 Tax=Achromobacter denitrificans TaxID=32002 RepID=UPI000F688960|nr:SPOR domain-containing protein [Achromobacter denitrificans]MBV2161321.1 SPOR domain-containing protein [Achromobacter denitrificans]RSE90383.1 SPOR domain-containing protein [Achromobacter denitrificans]WFC68139.1 SPOR domain-containing protein [Achromobacter denitrificans]